MLASGTERRNRKDFPINLDVTSKISRGDNKFVYRKNLTVCHWFDNKDAFCLSTLLSDTVTTVSRQVDKERRDITCPDSIVDYNKYMGGVDLADLAMFYYSVGRKTLKWWRRIFWRMHDQAVTNTLSCTRLIL